MSFNSVQLPDFLIAGLYKKLLVEEPQNANIHSGKEELKMPDSKPLQFLGKNLQHFVILVYYPNEVYLPEIQLDFLGNILKACQLNLGDVAIVNCYSQPITLEQLQPLHPKHIINFGVEQIAPQLITDEHFSIRTQNSINIINTPAFEILNQNTSDGKQLKAKLWGSLKQLLNI